MLEVLQEGNVPKSIRPEQLSLTGCDQRAQERREKKIRKNVDFIGIKQ
jgi:hypothetical protein